MAAINHEEAKLLVQTLNNPYEAVAEMLIPKANHKQALIGESGANTPLNWRSPQMADIAAPFHLLWKSPLLPSSGFCKDMYKI